MNFVKVDSSQIAEVGYMGVHEGPDAPGVLGVRFKTKAGYSEYHYGNVSAAVHQELMGAESIGRHFGQYIKGCPNLYPFTKIEADPNPTPPPSNPPRGGGERDISTTTKTTSETSTKSHLPFTVTDGEDVAITNEPSSTLSIIDSTSAEKLFSAGGVTDAQLQAGREWYLTEAKKYDISTEERRTELKRFARPLQKLRTGIEARAKEFTGETKRKLAAIDTEKRRLVMIVGGIEDDVLRPLTEWEAAENERKSTLAAVAACLATKGQPHLYLTIGDMDAAIAELEAFDTSTMQEYKLSAESAIAASLKVLKPELVRRQEAERNAAELAELRRKQAERDEQDRQAEQKRHEVAAPEKPAPTQEEHVDDEVVRALMGCGITMGEARSVMLAIKMQLIPHVTLTY